MVSGINWLDVVYFTILLGMIYKGSHAGVGSQILSLLWVFVLIFFSLGYYSVLASSVFGFVVQNWARPTSFCIIAGISFISIKFLQMIFNVSCQEQLPPIERIGGAVIAVLRTFLLFGIIGIQFLLLPIPPLQNAVAKSSGTAMTFVRMDAAIYGWLSKHVQIVKKQDAEEVVKEILKSSGTLEK